MNRFLISDAIDTNIFGMHSEERFKVISRDNSKGVLSFTTINGSQVNMRFFCEKKSDVNCGHVFVHKATVLQPQSLSLVKSKLKNKKIDNESLMVLNGIEDFSIKTSDLLLSNVTSRSLYVPVRNDSNDEVTLKKGHYLGHTSDVEMDNSMDTNIAAISSLCVEDNKAMNEERKLGNSLLKQEGDIAKLQKLLRRYDMAVKQKGKSLPLEHSIELTDEVPVSQQPRRLPFSLKQPIKEQLDSLEKSGIITRSDSKYGSPIIPVKEKW